MGHGRIEYQKVEDHGMGHGQVEHHMMEECGMKHGKVKHQKHGGAKRPGMKQNGVMFFDTVEQLVLHIPKWIIEE